MREPIDAQLASRRARIAPRRRFPGLGPSMLLHGAVVVMLFLGPGLFARAPEPFEYVSVQVMPLQALGTPDAAPTPARPEPEPEPETPPPAPEPEPRREPEPPAPEPRVPAPDPAPPSPDPEPEPRTPEPSPDPPQRTPTPPSRTPPAEDEAPAGPPGTVGSPEGSPRGTSPLGTTIAGLDNPDFTYGYYLDRMLGMIAAGWRPPVTGDRLQAVVHYRVLRDGTIRDVEVIQSSGNPAFDLAGLRAVQSASPLPPLPAGYRHDTLGVNLILH